MSSQQVYGALTHDQALTLVAEAAERLPEPAGSAILAVTFMHHAQPAPYPGPDPSCEGCHGSGQIRRPDEMGGGWGHCHCACPWCVGCCAPVCDGPCPTVEALAVALEVQPVVTTDE